MGQNAVWGVDAAGHERGGCCISMSLRDDGRNGEFVLEDGMAGRAQTAFAEAIRDAPMDRADKAQKAEAQLAKEITVRGHAAWSMKDLHAGTKETQLSFATPLSLAGPLRRPRQMLADQEYSGHTSIHDDAMAEKLGFRAGPIEGPTHFSQFQPLLAKIWGRRWFESGCISSHFLNMVVEGEEVRGFADVPPEGACTTRIWAEKADGTPVLEASASVGQRTAPTLLERRMAALRPPGDLLILKDLRVGMTGAKDEHVRMGPDENMGSLYPFSLNQKLEVITETSPWYSDPGASPWGRAIIPFEMLSVLFEYSSREAAFPVRGPAVGLFADQEIRLIDGPLFVSENYVVKREIVALAESRRTESYWVRTRVFDSRGEKQVAEMLLNHASLKQSYAGYADPADA